MFERDFFPIYPANKKVQSWDIYACVRQVLDVLDPIDEPLPKSVLQQRNLITEDEALRAIHLAENTAERERAQARLTFDEAVGLQWALVGRRYSELSESGPVASPASDGLLTAMREQLPFELTSGQKEVLDVLSAELSQSRPMNRMLQGEVGSGKTIVSVLAMLQLIDAGYQCALLAPTEVLAAQHARSIRDVLGPLAMAGQLGGAEGATRVALLTGSMSAQQKREVRDEVATGDAGIVIGTHALLQEAVEFKRLGMVVVDEQHRFGVEQRDTVARQGSRGAHATSVGDDRHADSTHRRADRLRRSRDLHAARTASGPPAHHDQHDLHQGKAGMAATAHGSASSKRSAPAVRPTSSPPASTRATNPPRTTAVRPPPRWSNCSTTLQHGALSGTAARARCTAGCPATKRTR